MTSHIDLMPHAVCWRADPRLIWTMVITNAITFLSYLSICLTLFYMVLRTRKVIARDWAYFVVGFALFIVACGTTHLMEVITTWIPVFWIASDANVITAVLSAYVAFMLVRRAGAISFGINDYAERLGNTETEKARLLESLLAAQKLEDWSRMSAAVTHEINNPLEAIHNLLYLIRKSEGVSPEVVELARTAADEAEQVRLISRNTLSFFRQTSEAEAVDLLAAAESVRFVLDSALSARGVKLHIEATGDSTVNALPGETRQVLLNLVRNAGEAIPCRNGDVTVALTGEKDSVEVVVSDNGTGIAPALLPNLFRFGASTKGDQGNGMGLWTVKQIIERHGGKIRVESKPGEGTRFTLQWPREYPGHPHHADASTETVGV